MPNIPFPLVRIPGLPDERVSDVKVAPMWSGGALVTYTAGDRVHLAWYWPETGQFKPLDDDLFDTDPHKDEGGIFWPTPHGIACLVSHTTDATGTGVSARLYGGMVDAPWIKDAHEYRLLQLIDERAQAIVTAALQGTGGGEADHADGELQAEIDRLKSEVANLHALIVGLESIAMGTAEKLTTAGRALVG
jgi:hypothetical protein